jgi:hypothetical protein
MTLETSQELHGRTMTLSHMTKELRRGEQLTGVYEILKSGQHSSKYGSQPASHLTRLLPLSTYGMPISVTFTVHFLPYNTSVFLPLLPCVSLSIRVVGSGLGDSKRPRLYNMRLHLYSIYSAERRRSPCRAGRVGSLVL